MLFFQLCLFPCLNSQTWCQAFHQHSDNSLIFFMVNWWPVFREEVDIPDSNIFKLWRLVFFDWLHTTEFLLQTWVCPFDLNPELKQKLFSLKFLCARLIQWSSFLYTVPLVNKEQLVHTFTSRLSTVGIVASDWIIKHDCRHREVDVDVIPL